MKSVKKDQCLCFVKQVKKGQGNVPTQTSVLRIAGYFTIFLKATQRQKMRNK